ncbi:MAG: response regulator [Desulfobacterales bacterium]|nr:response regulator [Desulfobacterales bacterium]
MGYILIVDDEQQIRDLVSFRLNSQGYIFKTADCAEAALEIIKEEQPDLMVLDVSMPRMTGVELCQLIKSDPETSSIKILMLTGKVEEEDEAEGLSAGADFYMTKPFSARELSAKIEELLENNLSKEKS